MKEVLAEVYAEEFIENLLVEPLLHGDEAHKEWLKKELRSKVGDLANAFERYKEETNDQIKTKVTGSWGGPR